MAKRKPTTAKEAALPQSQSLDALRDQVSSAVQSASCSCDPSSQFCQCTDDTMNCSCDDTYVWVRDLFPDKVVYSMGGKLYQRGYGKDANDNIVLGSPIEVEVAYTPLGESHRSMCRDVLSLKEAGASYNAKSGDLTLTVIKPGFNSSKSRYYPASVLKRDFGVFENAKMFLNHQTDKEVKERPEGSVNDWAAQIKKVWAQEDGTIKATARVIDPPFKEKLATLQDSGLLSEMGISIRAIGKGSDAEVAEGDQKFKTQLVEGFIASRSVDFVTYAGAGGQCEVLESDRSDEFDLELATVAQIRERRPDLIELIESKARGEVQKMKTLEQELAEAKAALTAKTTEAEGLRTQLTEAETKTKRAEVAVELTKLLEAAKLPKPAEDRIRLQFKEADKVDGMKEAIEAEREYIAKLTPGNKGSGVKNLGAKENGNTEVSESADTPVVDEKALVKSFMSMGLSESEAKIAANVQ